MAKILIIGNSAAGFSTCENLLKGSPAQEITVISKEEYPAYKRYLLADYLSGSVKDDELFLCGADYYKKNNINFLPGSEVERLDTRKQRIILKGNTKINYDYLVIASGSVIKLPDIPGKAKDGVVAFYTLKDAKLVKDKLMLAQTVCVIGQDEAALKIAEAAALRGKEVKIVAYADFVYHGQNDKIELISGAQPQEFIGEGALQALKLSSGKVIGTNLVLVAGGRIPSTGFLKESDIKTDQGYIIVDDNMRTNLKNVFACGSVCKKEGSPAAEKTWEESVREGTLASRHLINLLEGKSEGAMSLDDLIQLAATGRQAILKAAQDAVEAAIKEKGASHNIGFPETNYYLPLINALLKLEVKDLGGCLESLKQIKDLGDNKAAPGSLNVDSLGGLLNQGLATLLCEEILAALKYSNKEHPRENYAGFLPDTLLRSLGIQLVDGRIAGIAVILGAAPDEDSAVRLIRDFQSRSIVSILAGNIDGRSLKKQLESKNIEIGLDNYIVALGEDYLSAIYAVNWAVRAPLMYGGIKSGQWGDILKYTRQKVPAFVLLLGHVDEVLAATGLGALAMGFPIITDLDIPQLGKIDTTLFEALVTEKDYTKLAAKCIEIRGLKVKITRVPVPVPYAAAFEGERVRKEQLHAEFGGKSSTAFEYLTTKETGAVEDGKVELIGPDIDCLEKGSKSMPLAIVVEVAGRKMQKDFEPILERQIHRFMNYAMGLMHIGQRDMNWIRISKDAFNKGFRLKHIGVILHAMLHQEYGAIVDKVQVRLYTRQADLEGLLAGVKKVYDERDERISGMVDESVDTFYSCLLCQSFAPNHVCVVTPERLGLCGAYSWLDAKASFEITPTGPNQPIIKGPIRDERLGQWDNINEFVAQKSNKTVESVSMYSLMVAPQSSCGCFECIVAIIPEANGVMVVHRDHSGQTPCGMTFTALAGSVGGGIQTPGFLGVGKLYILSKKFILAEGGLKRVVWMPKELKEALGDKLKKRAEELGSPDLIDKIADETIATTTEDLLRFLEKVSHPALGMEPIM
ncbi:MAG: acetyl-CoA decarbonylase/synthase complex subunit alpha/beta [Candidatus Omnitrophota bacterium]